MKDFAGKIALITGAGSGIGRALARQLAAEGCDVVLCDISAAGLAETERLCRLDGPPQGARLSSHLADVSVEDQLVKVRQDLASQLQTDKIHLLVNNAGIAGGGSVIADSRAAWERTFNICWGGVYLGVRTFLPMLQKADEGHIVNVSSVNGLWASIGKGVPHTAYCAAKFAVRGFTEALMTDLQVNAPHVKCSVVMPGHIATGIIANSRQIQEGVQTSTLTAGEIARIRERLIQQGHAGPALGDDAIQAMSDTAAHLGFAAAPTSAEAAARIILDGVRAERWRILVGEDAVEADRQVRAHPEEAYTDDFYQNYAPAFARLSGVTDVQ